MAKPGQADDLLIFGASGHAKVVIDIVEKQGRYRIGGLLDDDAALSACRAGFRDVCATILEAAERAETAIAALQAGCDSPDAWMCYHLSALYSPACAQDDLVKACPSPNRTKSEHFLGLACRLDPRIAPCQGRSH